jgi:valyl-tRNA synthetase
MSSQLDKTYDPKAIESDCYVTWEDADYFKPSGKGNPFCIMLPPPNVTGSLHMGHAMEASLMDCQVRYHRMLGDNTHWQVGTDHAGIATQMVVERQLAADNITRTELGRDKFIEKVWQWKEQSGNTIVNQFKRMGASADWAQQRFTMDEGMSNAVRTVFIELFDEGIIYRGKRLVNWDTKLHTAVSDLEVEHRDEDTSLWHIRYHFVDAPEKYIVVATTRPETLLGDVCVAVNPDDERYKDYIGKMLQLPLTERHIPIIADNYVDAEFGSGCVKITPGHDFNDYEVGQRHDMGLINVFTIDGKLNEHAPEAYRGMDRYEARKQIIKDLEAQNLLDEIEAYRTKRPYGDRSGTILEPMLTDQWYVKVAPLAEVAMTAVEKGDIQFIPSNWKNTYDAWMKDVKDWCISRQLWWGHRVPAWYDDKGNIYVAEDEAAVRKKYNLTNDIALKQDDDVLDTWFSSALFPFSTLGWPNETEAFKTFYPTSVLITGFDIIFFWVARMIMMGIKFTGKVPFHKVYIHGLICDHEGQKMSKSKGNVLDPIDLIDGIDLESLVAKRTRSLMQPKMAKRIEKATRKDFPEGIPGFGTDAVRFTFCALPATNRHIQFDLNRIASNRNFCNKIWNATRYVLMNLEALPKLEDCEFSLADRYIQSKLLLATRSIREGLDTFRFDFAALAAYEFVWHEFCDWYLELSKPLLQSDDVRVQNGARYTLITVLETIMRLLHPFMPYITEEIWQRLSEMTQPEVNSVMLAAYPEFVSDKVDTAAVAQIDWLKNIILAVRNIRGEMNISPKQSLKVLVKHAEAEDQQRWQDLDRLLQQMANIKNAEFLSNDAAVPMSASAVVGHLELFVPMEGLIDVEAEIARLNKQISKLEKEHGMLSGKLQNKNYVDRAPAELVQRDQVRVDELATTIAKLQGQLKALG